MVYVILSVNFPLSMRRQIVVLALNMLEAEIPRGSNTCQEHFFFIFTSELFEKPQKEKKTTLITH